MLYIWVGRAWLELDDSVWFGNQWCCKLQVFLWLIQRLSLSLNSYGCQVDADGYWVVNAYSIEIAMYFSSNSYDCHVDADRYWVVNAYSIEIAMKWKNISEHDWAMKCWIGCFKAIIFSPLAYYNYCCCTATASSEKFIRSFFWLDQ